MCVSVGVCACIDLLINDLSDSPTREEKFHPEFFLKFNFFVKVNFNKKNVTLLQYLLIHKTIVYVTMLSK